MLFSYCGRDDSQDQLREETVYLVLMASEIESMIIMEGNMVTDRQDGAKVVADSSQFDPQGGSRERPNWEWWRLLKPQS